MAHNKFGGKWTRDKIEAFMEYVHAYLVIMNSYPQFKLLYFDGFAGSGVIMPGTKGKFPPAAETRTFLQGVATSVLSVSEPKSFDLYCFIEKKPENADSLRVLVKAEFPEKISKIQIVTGDCNEKLVVLSKFLRKPREKPYRSLLFIDPYGMQLSWQTLAVLKGLQLDMWILVPSGVAIGRLLKRNGDINSGRMKRLVDFLGMDSESIMDYFYTKHEYESQIEIKSFYRKKPHATTRIGQLFRERIAAAGIFKFVTNPMVLKNSRNVPIYHFILCTNNAAGLNIGNSIANKRR